MPRQDPGEPYFRVDSAEGQAMITADPDGTVVIDVRRDDEWITGHVAGAIHIPGIGRTLCISGESVNRICCDCGSWSVPE